MEGSDHPVIASEHVDELRSVEARDLPGLWLARRTAEQEGLGDLLGYERRLGRLEMELGREIDTPSIWWGRGRPLTPSGITQIIQARALAAAVAAAVAVTTHSFRRAFAIAWLKRGGSESYLRSVCGWRSAEMVKRYTSSVINDEAIAMQRRLFG